MDWSELTENERLMAEHAVLAYRAVEAAAMSAPMGKGMETVERVIHDKGSEYLRAMIQTAISARPEAQKRGSVSGGASAAASGSSSG